MKLVVHQFVVAPKVEMRQRAASPVGLAVWFVAVFGLTLFVLYAL